MSAKVLIVIAKTTSIVNVKNDNMILKQHTRDAKMTCWREKFVS